MIVALASDHNGVALRRKLWFELPVYPLAARPIDLGPFSGETVDYTTYARQLGEIVASGDCDRGILICGTGVGMSIAANKVHGVRAALVHNHLSAVKSREHNSANVLCLGSWIVSDEKNIEFAREWLAGEFGEGRHVPRVEAIEPRKRGLVFCSGAFDLLHAAHVDYLKRARSLGHWLVVGLNSDASLRALKGPARPVIDEAQRKFMLENLPCVDEVIVFDEATPENLVRMIGPDVVVDGSGKSVDEVRAHDGIADGIEIVALPRGVISTTDIIDRISNAVQKVHDFTRAEGNMDAQA
jgi:ribose 5-phosphate isomerase B